ncbi:flavin reductase [Flavobacteriaceae bacterium]|nr:flavin reductase [Flavobacteriaceae bacterium]
MIWNEQDISSADKVTRLRMINAITGIKPANLIGTQDASGRHNLAVFSSVVHLGSSPALIGFILRPYGEVPRHTWQNIQTTGHYTINHIPASMTQQAHRTSAKFPEEVSEFEHCGFTPELIPGIQAPFVGESTLKMGLSFVSATEIPLNGTTLVIGKIIYLSIPDEFIDQAGELDLERAHSTGISGLNTYYSLKKIGQYPYARLSDMDHENSPAEDLDQPSETPSK